MPSKKTGRKSPADKLRAELDAAEPMGFRTEGMHDPQARASQLLRVGETLKNGGLGRTANPSESNTVPFVGRTPLLYVDPMFDPILFLFPKDRIDEINKRLRHYYETDPIVGNAIDLHSTLPLSDFYLEAEDPAITRYWNDFKERSGLLEFLRCMVHDYFLCGEGIGLPIWDPHNFEFSHFNQYPPENVDIFRTYVTPTSFFMLKPDPKLAEKVRSGANIDQTLLSMMPKDYVASLQEGRQYLLGDDKKVIYFARQTTKYRNRGISILSRCLKDLLYKDKLRLLQLTFVDRHMFPIKIFKLGSEQRGWIPNRKHFQKLQQLLTQASNDPDFNIIYHFGLQVDYVGTKDKIWNLIPEFEWVERQVMAALFVNEEIIHGGLPSSVRDTVNLRTLMHRYMDIREKVERFMMTHIFLPIAQARGFYKSIFKKKTSNQQYKMIRIGKKDVKVPVTWINKEAGLYTISHDRHTGMDLSMYDLPRPMWKKINLFNNIAEQQILLKLEEDGKFPLDMVFDMLGHDPDHVKERLKVQYSSVFDPLWRQVREEVGRDKSIRLQVLEGVKPWDWKKLKDTELDAPATGPTERTKKAPTPTDKVMPGRKPAEPKKTDNGKPAPEQKTKPSPSAPPSEMPPTGPVSPTTRPEDQ